MNPIRPTGLPVPQRPASTPAAGGSRAAAFFQAAVADTAPARPTTAPPIAVQLQTQAQPQRQRPARPFVQPSEPPQKLLRPGSLLNILV